jgi:hypothetical protein
MTGKKLSACLTLLAVVAFAKDGWAWGATGHEWVSGIAIEKLPDSLPAFVRSPETVGEIAVMGRELERSKGAGKTHDAERDPGHYVDLFDDGAVMGVLPLAKLPETYRAARRRLHAIQSGLPAVFDRRRLAADPKGFRLVANPGPVLRRDGRCEGDQRDRYRRPELSP